MSLLTLAPGVEASPRLWVEQDEILVQTMARNDRGELAQADDARISARVVGPQGVEASRLVPPSFKVDGGYRPLVVRVEHGPEAGWREVTIDVGLAIPKARFPGARRPSFATTFRLQDTAEADRQLRSRWLNKPVWLLGAAIVPQGFGGHSSVEQVGRDPRLPATVIGVERRERSLVQLSSTDCWDLFGNWGGVDFYTSNPLAIRLRLPPKGRLRLSGSVGGFAGWKPDPSPGRVIEATVYLADPWQIPRRFAPSPEPILGRETAKVQNAFARREIVVGMPRSLVALILGDPEAGVPLEKVWSRKDWTYSGGLDSYTVWFDARGRVSSYGLQLYKLP